MTLRPHDPARFARLCVHAMALALGVALLPGCSRRAESASAAVLRISQRNEPSDLDPATASLPDEFFIIRALGEGLLTPNPAGGPPLPAAAARFEVSENRRTYTFHLRDEALWSNGEPVTAEDFIASFQRVLTPATAAPKAHLFYAVRNARAFVAGEIRDFGQVGFHAVDAHTLAITLERPLAGFPLQVASGPWIPINPRIVTRYGRQWTQPGHHVGNGPFILAEWRPQQRIVVKRNPRYAGASSARLDEIAFIRFDSQETEDRAYRAGQIDVTMAVPQTRLDVYARERPQDLHQAALAETRFLSFNTRRVPLTDVRVRRALALAIDRGKLVQHVLRGGQRPAPRFLSPALGLDGREPPETRFGFDPAAARRLFAAAGFPSGAGFPRLELSGWVNNPVLEAIQQMWRQELGIDVAIVVREAKVHLAAVNAGTYDIAFVTNLLDMRDAVSALADFMSDAPNNFPHWHSARFDGLLTAALQEPDPGKAALLTVSAEAMLLEDAAVAPVYFNTQNWLMSPRVHGWQQDPLWTRRYNDAWIDPR